MCFVVFHVQRKKPLHLFCDKLNLKFTEKLVVNHIYIYIPPKTTNSIVEIAIFMCSCKSLCDLWMFGFRVNMHVLVLMLFNTHLPFNKWNMKRTTVSIDIAANIA